MMSRKFKVLLAAITTAILVILFLLTNHTRFDQPPYIIAQDAQMILSEYEVNDETRWLHSTLLNHHDVYRLEFFSYFQIEYFNGTRWETVSSMNEGYKALLQSVPTLSVLPNSTLSFRHDLAAFQLQRRTGLHRIKRFVKISESTTVFPDSHVSESALEWVAGAWSGEGPSPRGYVYAEFYLNGTAAGYSSP